MTTHEIVKILEEISVLLELKGENPFKARSYKAAARTLESLDDELDTLVREGKLQSIRGIGEALSRKIGELVLTGRLGYYETLRTSIQPGHLEMLRIPGLGPKKIKALYDLLGIETIGELEYACHENHLTALAGFGRKTQEKILEGIGRLRRYQERRLHAEVISEAQELLKWLNGTSEVTAACLAGSLRRSNETVKDIDMLAASRDPVAVGSRFISLPGVESVIAQGETKVSVMLHSGVPCDLRIVSDAAYPYALHHFTGSREHNTAMRGRAKRMGLKMNEYGLFRGEDNVLCRSEEDLFKVLGLSFIPPELRENMGEIESSEKGELPVLLEERDIRGLFHIHTRASDGADSLETLARAAIARGFEYIGISDHSRSAFYAGGLSVEAVLEQHAEIDRLNAKYAPFHIFKGIESDILPDGRLDYEEDVLSRFDFVIAAVHSHFGMSEAEMTQRIVRALANPFTTMLAHPTGRLLLAREPYRVDMREVIDTAAAEGKVLELNINPQRLDLDWRHCIAARRRGVRIVLGADIHKVDGFDYLPLGVRIARKGWLEAKDCINALARDEMRRFLSQRRQQKG